MAATNVKFLNSSEKTYHAARLIGTGAPADGDTIATDVTAYPLGSEYLDTTGKKLWRRVAVAGVAADWAGIALV